MGMRWSLEEGGLLVKRWKEGGEVESVQTHGLQSSVDILDRFWRYWLTLETDGFVEKLEMLKWIEQNGMARTIPELPMQKRGQARMRQTNMFEFDSDVQIVSGLSNAAGHGNRRRRQNRGNTEYVPSSDVESTTDYTYIDDMVQVRTIPRTPASD